MLGTIFTAALSIVEMERNGLTPDSGPVIVTGATGGVGSFAVEQRARLGYRVTALTGKDEAHDYLRELGAEEVLSRHSLQMVTVQDVLPTQGTYYGDNSFYDKQYLVLRSRGLARRVAERKERSIENGSHGSDLLLVTDWLPLYYETPLEARPAGSDSIRHVRSRSVVPANTTCRGNAGRYSPVWKRPPSASCRPTTRISDRPGPKTPHRSA